MSDGRGPVGGVSEKESSHSERWEGEGVTCSTDIAVGVSLLGHFLFVPVVNVGTSAILSPSSSPIESIIHHFPQ